MDTLEDLKNKLNELDLTDFEKEIIASLLTSSWCLGRVEGSKETREIYEKAFNIKE